MTEDLPRLLFGPSAHPRLLEVSFLPLCQDVPPRVEVLMATKSTSGADGRSGGRSRKRAGAAKRVGRGVPKNC